MKFNFDDIPKFCISLKRSKDRRKIVAREFKSVGLKVEFFDGIDKNDIVFPELCTKTPGVLGCASSHVALIKYAKESGFSAICIFEDDVIFCDDFWERIEYIEGIPDFRYDIFCLGGHWSKKDMQGVSEPTKWKWIYKSIAMGGTYAYIITKNVYDFVLRNIHYNYGMDEFYANHVYRRFKSYAMTPFLAGSRPCLSEITGNVHEYENVGWFYQQDELDFKANILDIIGNMQEPKRNIHPAHNHSKKSDKPQSFIPIVRPPAAIVSGELTKIASEIKNMYNGSHRRMQLEELFVMSRKWYPSISISTMGGKITIASGDAEYTFEL